MEIELQTQLDQMARMLTQLIHGLAALKSQVNDIHVELHGTRDNVAVLKTELAYVRDELRAEISDVRAEIRYTKWILTVPEVG